MTKEEVFDKAWKVGLKGDFSLVDEIYHSKYRAVQKNINVSIIFRFRLEASQPPPSKKRQPHRIHACHTELKLASQNICLPRNTHLLRRIQ